jgi:hypothetical protein
MLPGFVSDIEDRPGNFSTPHQVHELLPGMANIPRRFLGYAATKKSI